MTDHETAVREVCEWSHVERDKPGSWVQDTVVCGKVRYVRCPNCKRIVALLEATDRAAVKRLQKMRAALDALHSACDVLMGDTDPSDPDDPQLQAMQRAAILLQRFPEDKP